jgi:ABC-type spermidine/putrescine transport system permease subunit II
MKTEYIEGGTIMLEPTQRKDSSALSSTAAKTYAIALLFVLLFLVLPVFINFIMSLKEYNYKVGLFKSPWFGLENYWLIFNDPYFSKALLQSLALSLISSITLFALSIPVGLLISATGRIRWLRHGLCTLLLVPLIVPQEIWAWLFMNLFPRHAIDDTWALASWSVLRFIGLPALLASVAATHGKLGLKAALMAGGLVSLVLFATIDRLDYTFFHMLFSPYTQNLSTYIFRPLAQPNLIAHNYFATSASVQVIQQIFHLALLAAIAFPVAAIGRHLLVENSKPDDMTLKNRLVALAVPGSALAIAAVVLLSIVAGSKLSSQEQAIYTSLTLYNIIALVSAALNTTVCFLLARHVACAVKKSRQLMIIALLVLSALSVSACSTGEYLIFRSVGMSDTYFAILLSGIGSVWGVWPLLLATRSMGVSNRTDWFKHMWKPCLALFAAQAMFQMNNTVPALLYIDKQNYQHPLNFLSSFSIRALEQPLNMALMVLATMIVPVILLLIIRTMVGEKDSLGLFLPGK